MASNAAIEPIALRASDTAGDVDSFERLIATADQRLRAVVYRLVGSDVDDVMQSTYLRAFAGWSAFQARSTSTTWLYRIAINTSLDHLRADHRAVVVAGRARPAGPQPDIATSAADAVDLGRAVDELPFEQRVVLLLIDQQGCSHADAADVLGVPVGTVGSRLSRARQAVRAALEGTTDDPR